MKVLGIGDVTLPVKTDPQRTGAASQGTTVLRDVCYAPDAFCNILGTPILKDLNYIPDFGSGGSSMLRNKKQVQVWQ